VSVGGAEGREEYGRWVMGKRVCVFSDGSLWITTLDLTVRSIESH